MPFNSSNDNIDKDDITQAVHDFNVLSYRKSIFIGEDNSNNRFTVSMPRAFMRRGHPFAVPKMKVICLEPNGNYVHSQVIRDIDKPGLKPEFMSCVVDSPIGRLFNAKINRVVTDFIIHRFPGLTAHYTNQINSDVILLAMMIEFLPELKTSNIPSLISDINLEIEQLKCEPRKKHHALILDRLSKSNLN